MGFYSYGPKISKEFFPQRPAEKRRAYLGAIFFGPNLELKGPGPQKLEKNFSFFSKKT